MTPLTRDDLDHGLDRALAPINAELRRLADEMRDAGISYAAMEVETKLLTTKVGELHKKTGVLSDDLMVAKAISTSDGRVVRVRDVVLSASAIGTAIVILKFLKVLP